MREASARKDPTNGGPSTHDRRWGWALSPQAPSLWPGFRGDVRWKRLGHNSQESVNLVEENSVSYTRRYAQILKLEAAEFCWDVRYGLCSVAVMWPEDPQARLGSQLSGQGCCGEGSCLLAKLWLYALWSELLLSRVWRHPESKLRRHSRRAKEKVPWFLSRSPKTEKPGGQLCFWTKRLTIEWLWLRTYFVLLRNLEVTTPAGILLFK